MVKKIVLKFVVRIQPIIQMNDFYTCMINNKCGVSLSASVVGFCNQSKVDADT